MSCGGFGCQPSGHSPVRLRGDRDTEREKEGANDLRPGDTHTDSFIPTPLD